MATEIGKRQEEEGGEQGNMVSVTNDSLFVPTKVLKGRECPLVTFDLPFLTSFYSQKLLVYKIQDRIDKKWEEMVKKMKESLDEILVDFYPLAGKLGRDKEHVWRIDCNANNLEVKVVEAVAASVGVAELGADESSSLLQEVVPYTDVFNWKGLDLPLLAVQFTKLKDGLAIGCAFNHVVLDDISTWHFMRSWADICCGSTPISVSGQPFHDRAKAGNTRVKLKLPLVDGTNPPEPPQTRERIFRFSDSAIDKINTDVNSSRSEGSEPFSIFQSLEVHIWRAITRARKVHPEDKTVFIAFVDCRKRVVPPMPDNYFGNLIQAVVLEETEGGTLLTNPPSSAASDVQKAIEKHDSKAIDCKNKKWEANPELFQHKDAGPNCVAVGSSPGLKVFDIDFGWGKPETVRSGRNNKFDGMVYLYHYQEKDGGMSIDAEISLKTQAMENLEKDVDFHMQK